MGDIAAMFSAGGGNKVYLTFLKWAGIIVVVVALITALVAAISVLTGKGDEMSRTMDSLGGSVGNMTGSLQGGNIPRYASGTDYHPGGLALVLQGLVQWRNPADAGPGRHPAARRKRGH